MAFSAGGDGGRKSREHPAQVAHIEFASTSIIPMVIASQT
jgi:hypothetical protein